MMNPSSDTEASLGVPERRNSAEISTCSRASFIVSRPLVSLSFRYHSVEMSSPDYDLVTRLADSINHSSTVETSNRRDETPSPVETYRAIILRIDQDEARLAARGCTWYEIKASTLRQSDISVIRDKAGINDLYEVVIPHVRDRAHRPPPGFHSFYVNQIDRGLKFPISKFITDLCDHLGVSPSQLTPNSFSSLLSLGILLKFFRVPLSTFTIMRLVQIKRYFFVKRISSRENPWGCDMSWRDEARAQPPPTPERASDLTDFLRVTREKCFNAQELIEEDLLCYFKFSGKKVQLVGDLGERMSKAEMLRALREKKADPEGASRSLSKGKRKITEEGGEKPKKRHHEKKTRESDRDKVSGETTKETPSSGGQNPEQQTNETSYEYLDASNISFVAKPSGSVSLDFTRRLISDQDYDLALVWSGSMANRLIQEREEVTKTKHSMDEMLENHEGLMKQLAEIRANNDKEKEVMALELEASRAEAQLSNARALRAEEENRALQAEVDRWKGEEENSLELGKEKFLQSKEFKVLCSGKALTFFEKGFDGCLAQFRESGYTEEEHPAPFLDVERALASMSDDEDAEEDGSGLEKTPPA
ncbi:hypothetical protein F511_31380 [Dorcoceras hygrometricum]|uniref:Uncharacterized protein n=1 Tax=Dorcoceras hygrometricum TaxID=472368 RepID=A0A2Z7BA07_9LAMI|nr:hypothetical protein F511_31380 [Dorcoceras hygrometricum]